MPLEVTNLKRGFSFKQDGKDVSLPDPNPEFTVQEVIQFYSGQYPELTTCTIDGPAINNDMATYTFKTTVGTKA